MITVLQKGCYRLLRTGPGTQVLSLDNKEYLLTDGKIFPTHCQPTDSDLLATGNYRLYDVTDEPHLSDQVHLELNVGYHAWQSYLLPDGLPTHKPNIIRPTRETISLATTPLPL